MKKIVGLFLWLCAATLIAQGCILTLSYLRGNLDKDSLIQVMAILNGIDVQGTKIGKLINTQATPQPSMEEVLNERAREATELDARSAAIERQKGELESKQRTLEVEIERLEGRKREFEERLNSLSNGAEEEGIRDVQTWLQDLPPDQAKVQILSMLEKKNPDDVVTILKGLNPAKRKKILGEFTAADETAKLAEVFAQLRSGGKAKSIIDEARAESPDPAQE